MAAEKRTTFNEIPKLYDEVRPRYPDQLFDDLIALADLRSGARILEVGTGTGIATMPLAERGYEIVGVELGSELAAVAERKLAQFANVEIVVADFEDWTLPGEPFDLVMSATAWHWLDPAAAFGKAAAALHRGGCLAIFGYKHIAGGDRTFFEHVQDCYRRFMPDTGPDERLLEPEQYEPDVDELEASGLFQKPQIRTYVTQESYTTDRYLELLSTYSGHRTLGAANRRGLFDCVGRLIDSRFEGHVRKAYMNELIVAGRAV
jgi:SAM-dependent methyltransferase